MSQRFFNHDDSSFRTEACSQRADKPHCWHRGTTTYTSNPSQHDETCCYCGESVRVQDPPLRGFGISYNVGDHGPFAQTRIMFGTSNPDA